MSTTMSRPATMVLDELAAELERRLETMDDFHADTRRLGFTVQDADAEEWAPNVESEGEPRKRRTVALDIDLAGEMWSGNVNDLAQDQMAARLDLPRKFWDKMRDGHPDILQETVRLLLGREPKVQFIRTLDSEVRAFLSNAYQPRDNFDLMDKAILPAIKEAKLDVVQCALTDQRMYLKLLFPKIEGEIKVGDIVRCGIIVKNSEVGCGSTSVEPFLYRLVCLNGMVAPVKFAEFGLRKHHVGRRIGDDREGLFSERSRMLDDAAFFSMVYDLVKNAATGVAFARMIDRLKEMTELRTTGDPVAVVERISRRERIGREEQATIMRHFIEGADLSAYGYMNAVTRAAQDAGSYDRRVELEAVGGDMIAWSDRAWRDLLRAESEEAVQAA